jgi:hypothetical protein
MKNTTGKIVHPSRNERGEGEENSLFELLYQLNKAQTQITP